MKIKKHNHDQIGLYRKNNLPDPLRGFCLKCKKYIETNPYTGEEKSVSLNHIKQIELKIGK